MPDTSLQPAATQALTATPEGRQPPGVPADLVAWFAGKGILADANGMPRFECRWRVVEVRAVLGDPDPQWQYVVRGQTWEGKTHKAALAAAARMRAEGHTVLVQFAPVLWLNNSEMPPPEPDGPAAQVAVRDRQAYVDGKVVRLVYDAWSATYTLAPLEPEPDHG